MNKSLASSVLSTALLGALALSSTVASAQTVLLQYAQPTTAVDQKINAKKVPVVQPDGSLKYYDITVSFRTSSAGVPSLDVANSKFAVVAAPVVPKLQPGLYLDSYGFEYQVDVGGPDASGRVNYNITGNGFSGTFLSGPVAGHPDVGTINNCQFAAAGIYGHVSDGSDLAVASVGATSIAWNNYRCLGGANFESTKSLKKYTP